MREPDRVEVWAGEEFRRPVRLSPREAMALQLGLRVLAADSAPERRAGLFSGGKWYVIGHCEEEGAVRVLRVDRVLEVTPVEGTFEVCADFDVAEYVTEAGRVYRADEEVEAVVHYAPEVARWAAGRGGAEVGPDGAAVVRLRVADPGWLVRHVLGYAAGAEVVRPVEERRWVGNVVKEKLCA